MSTTVITSQSPDRWSQVERTGENRRTMYPRAGRTLTWREDRLTPSRTWTVTVRAWITPATPKATSATIVVQGHIHQVQARAWATVTQRVDTLRPLVVEIPAAATAEATVTVTASADVPAHPLPHEVLALDAWLPIPTSALVWDQGRWDRTAWQTTAPVPGTLVWDQGRWDQHRWYDETLIEAWTPVLGPCTRISTRRGVTATGPVLQAEAGTLTLEATADLDPRALGMVVGTPIRLMHWPSLSQIWVGQVSEVRVTPLKGGGARVQVIAVDAVARIAAITRHGARPEGGGTETWTQRLNRLAASAHGIALHGARSTVPVCPTVWETSLAAHLDALVATTGGAWWADRYSNLQVRPTLPTSTPDLTLTDTHDDDRSGGHVWHYSAGPATWSSSSLISAIEATTHDAAPDDRGEWRARDVRVTVTDPTATAAWTGATARVDLLTPSTGDATRLAAQRLLARATTTPLLERATIWHCPTGAPTSAPASQLHRAAYLDPLQTVTAVQRGERATMHIASVAHEITPLTWRTDLTLTPTNRRGDLQ